MRELALAVTFAALITACATTADRALPSAPRAERAEAAEAVDVAVELRAPSRARWSASTLGPAKPTLGLVVTNRSASVVDVSDLRVRLDAVREGVSFRCAREVGPAPGAREPRSLAPGATHVFERELDCSLPLVGSYAVRVAVVFGGGERRQPREASAFTLRVFAPPHLEPRALDAVPGVWGALGASSVLVGDKESAGPGRIVVALVNGGPNAAPLPRIELALRVFRVGQPIPCEDEPTVLSTPGVLGPGATYREAIDVSCLGLGAPGAYEIAARLRIADVETEIGRLRVEITTDPPRKVPLAP